MTRQDRARRATGGIDRRHRGIGMTGSDAEERATEPRSLQVFDRVPRLIGRRDLIGEKSAAGGGRDRRDLTKSLHVTSQTLAYRERSHPRERRERTSEDA